MRSHTDHPGAAWLWSVPGVMGCLVIVLLCTSAMGSTTSCEGIEVHSEELTAAESAAYCRYAAQERQKVEAYWGATYGAAIRIHVSSQYRISRALVPGHFGNRGFMEMPLRRVRERAGSLLHEIVHIYAPNGNRLLAEGLAVYLHAQLAGNPAFPNFGGDLRHLASRSLSAVESLEALNSVRTPRALGTVIEERLAYTLAGSFVGFLIERYGLAAFRRLYETGDYASVYETPLERLEAA